MRQERVTIVDVARAAGVSRSTVSLVLRGDPSISAPTADRVRQTMTDLGYVYHRAAASLRANTSQVLGVILHDLTNPVFTEIAVGIDSKFQSAGFVQFIADSGDDVVRQRRIISSMREHGVAGLILSPASGTPSEELVDLTRMGLPVVEVGRNTDAGVSAVISDNVEGVMRAVEHLYELGHRRIAFLGGNPNTATYSDRVSGYHRAARELGFPTAPVITSSPTRTGGAEAFDALRAGSSELPTGVVAFNDVVAFGVLDRLRMAALRAGSDLSIVGFDDVPDAATSVPALTTVAVQPRSMGRGAATVLLQQVADPDLPPTRVIHPVTLVVRETTGPPPA